MKEHIPLINLFKLEKLFFKFPYIVSWEKILDKVEWKYLLIILLRKSWCVVSMFWSYLKNQNSHWYVQWKWLVNKKDKQNIVSGKSIVNRLG